jgi:hypothetical protein
MTGQLAYWRKLVPHARSSATAVHTGQTMSDAALLSQRRAPRKVIISRGARAPLHAHKQNPLCSARQPAWLTLCSLVQIIKHISWRQVLLGDKASGRTGLGFAVTERQLLLTQASHVHNSQLKAWRMLWPLVGRVPTWETLTRAQSWHGGNGPTMGSCVNGPSMAIYRMHVRQVGMCICMEARG